MFARPTAQMRFTNAQSSLCVVSSRLKAFTLHGVIRRLQDVDANDIIGGIRRRRQLFSEKHDAWREAY
jgi:hypothetical protein